MDFSFIPNNSGFVSLFFKFKTTGILIGIFLNGMKYYAINQQIPYKCFDNQKHN